MKIQINQLQNLINKSETLQPKTTQPEPNDLPF